MDTVNWLLLTLLEHQLLCWANKTNCPFNIKVYIPFPSSDSALSEIFFLIIKEIDDQRNFTANFFHKLIQGNAINDLLY